MEIKNKEARHGIRRVTPDRVVSLRFVAHDHTGFKKIEHIFRNAFSWSRYNCNRKVVDSVEGEDINVRNEFVLMDGRQISD